MQIIDIIPSHSRYSSRFLTTHRISFLHWLFNLVIFPFYASFVYLITYDVLNSQGVPSFIPDPLRFPLATVICLGACIPFLSNLYLPRHWRGGLRKQEGLILIGVLIISYFLFDYQTLIYPLHNAFLLWVCVGFWKLIRKSSYSLKFVAFALFAIIFFLLQVRSTISFSPLFDSILGVLPDIIFVLWSSLHGIMIIYFCSIYILAGRYITGSRALKIGKELLLRVLLFVFILLFGRYIRDLFPNNPAFVVPIAIFLFFISINHQYFLGYQIAFFRTYTHLNRQDRLYVESSPFVDYQNIWNRIRFRLLPSILNTNNRTFLLITIVVISGLLLPVLFYIATPVNPPVAQAQWTSSLGPLELVLIAFISIIGTSLFCFFLFLLKNRNYYIVTEFEANDEGDKAKPELDAIAKLATHVLVDELQKIASLLKLRQVENLHLNREDSNAFFVTSGINQDFFDQMQQMVTFDIPNTGKVQISSFFAFLIRLLARIQVRGRVQLRSNRSVEIWVELKYRNSQSAAVDMIILPENSLEDIDEILIRPVARELALKLLIKLGQLPHLGSSWKTADSFLQGLDASAKGNWWQAISLYREALQAEETVRGSFGIGHYHLGAALVFQGNWKEGLEHLRIAEADGPAMAEVQYMLALVLLYTYWGDLRNNLNVFKEINDCCDRAIALRPNFGEAHQLKGTVNYRLARTEDREHVDEQRDSKTRQLPDYQIHYQDAMKHYSRSLRCYDALSHKVKRYPNVYGEVQNQFHSLRLQRITVAHQLADSLRSIERYVEAESYYLDVRVTSPFNIRNLADLAKTYCLAGIWQYGEEYLWQTVFKSEIASWDADISIHMAWMICGGIVDKHTGIIHKILDPFLQQRALTSHNSMAYEIKTKNIGNWLGEAVEYLDFSIHQRPRYIHSWRQTNWFEAFKEAIEIVSTNTKHQASSTQTQPAVSSNQFTDEFFSVNINPDLYATWMALRIKSFVPQNKISENEVSKFLRSNYWTIKAELFFKSIKDSAYQDFEDLAIRLYKLKEEAHELDKKIGNIVQIRSIRNEYQRLVLAQKLQELFNAVNTAYEKLTREQSITFAGRWTVDLYHEVAMLTCRVLAESEAYEQLYKCAEQALKNSDDWIDFWRESYPGPSIPGKYQKHFTFTPRVSRYQRATLRAWKAFSRYQCGYDFLTRARIFTKKAEFPDLAVEEKDQLLDQAQNDVKEALQYIQSHPLALYTQAHIYYATGLYSQAIEELEILIDVIAPYDPKRDVGGSVLGMSGPNPTSNPDRSDLYHLEKVSGRQQFHNVINIVGIHTFIADIYQELDKPDLRVKHLIEAIRWSPHDDINIDNFLRLANQLNSMERYAEAQAIIEALRVPAQKLERLELSETKRRAPDILECVITTRRMRYTNSLQQGKRIAHKFAFIQPVNYINEIASSLKADEAKQTTQSKLTLTTGETPFMKAFREATRVLVEKQKPDAHPTKDETHSVPKDVKQVTREGIYRRICDFLNLSLKDPFFKNASLSALINESITKEDENSIIGADQTFHFPRIFTLLQNNKDLSKQFDETAEIALYALSHEALVAFLSSKLTDSKSPMGELQGEFSSIMFGHVAVFFSKQCYNSLIQFADLCNSLAYNRAETGLAGEKYAFVDSISALTVMSYLYQVSERDTKNHQYFSEKLAQYCDTYGWLHYRKVLPSIEHISRTDASTIDQDILTIHNAEDFLLKGVRYDPKRAIVHYHLARLYLSAIELIWQYAPKDVGGADIGRKAHMIDNYIIQASREWRNANYFDRFNRLHSRLAWLHSRINAYKVAWEKRQLNGIAGLIENQEPPSDIPN